jgi:hypothetical protein
MDDELSWSDTVTVLAARACAGLVVVLAAGWLPAPLLQAVSSNAAASPTAADSAV